MCPGHLQDHEVIWAEVHLRLDRHACTAQVHQHTTARHLRYRAAHDSNTVMVCGGIAGSHSMYTTQPGTHGAHCTRQHVSNQAYGPRSWLLCRSSYAGCNLAAPSECFGGFNYITQGVSLQHVTASRCPQLVRNSQLPCSFG
jgi:hypothetical protein